MSQFVMSRREFAGAVVSMATAVASPAEPDQRRRVVALGWISRHGGQVAIARRLAEADVAGGDAHV